jgi:hypothetical protein
MSKFKFQEPWIKLDQTSSALATVRYKYFYENYQNQQKTENILNQYKDIINKTTIYDNTNPQHQKLIADIIYQRELVKYYAQLTTEKVSPEAKITIDNRQGTKYGGQTQNPDEPGVLDTLVKRFGPKYDKTLYFILKLIRNYLYLFHGNNTLELGRYSYRKLPSI